jgi:2,3-bisphosphoglycerate-independent phosphoglycerate mutase
MKAYEIAAATIDRLKGNAFDFGRINFANGDMVGHTGNLEAAIIAVEVVDQMLGKLIAAAKQTDTILLITADHGNCDEMFQGEESKFQLWRQLGDATRPPPKTAHTLSPVPMIVFDPRGSRSTWHLSGVDGGGLANVANTCLDLLGLKTIASYCPSLVSSR